MYIFPLDRSHFMNKEKPRQEFFAAKFLWTDRMTSEELRSFEFFEFFSISNQKILSNVILWVREVFFVNKCCRKYKIVVETKVRFLAETIAFRWSMKKWEKNWKFIVYRLWVKCRGWKLEMCIILSMTEWKISIGIDIENVKIK